MLVLAVLQRGAIAWSQAQRSVAGHHRKQIFHAKRAEGRMRPDARALGLSLPTCDGQSRGSQSAFLRQILKPTELKVRERGNEVEVPRRLSHCLARFHRS